MKKSFFFILPLLFVFSCKKNPAPLTTPEVFDVTTFSINGNTSTIQYNIGYTPSIKLSFSAPVNKGLVPGNLLLSLNAVATIPLSYTYQNNDSTVILQPLVALNPISKYNLIVTNSLQSARNMNLQSAYTFSFTTKIDSSAKFPLLADNQLLDSVQRRTFRYFWEFGHPVSGMARERSNGDNNIVTSGGSGFGVMAIVAAVDRGFISRAQGLSRLQTIVSFLKNTVPHFHGAFSHWMNGATGAVVPFAPNDNGADLVETSFMMMGLITARQYFNGNDAAELNLRNDINTLWNGVEWDWFRQNGKKVLYWNWSPGSGWAVNVPVQGWNECLVTYVLAASSTTHNIPKEVYDSGFARSGAMSNNNTYYNYPLLLGPAYGGPLFFSHYSFLGINPNGLSDAYANYTTQTKNHTLINYNYCKANPKNFYGYSDSVWGLTASDIQNGYTASSPTNDVSVIASTAAISSFPYTPAESMAALKFFYYVLGDKLWKEYGFIDAFSLHNTWFADSYLAIDQGPIIVMIENYRSGLLWSLFTSAPEIKNGMKKLGFTAPYL